MTPKRSGEINISRSGKASWLVWIIWLGSVCFTPSSFAGPDRPNIILVVADYMGYRDIGPYGAQDISTPVLDKLAAEGVRYRNHYTSAPKCIPARASLMSGLYPSKALDYGRGLPAIKNHLLHGLKNRGYRAAMLGKWHLGLEPDYHPIDHGFDTFFGYSAWTLSPHSHKTSSGKAGLWRNKHKVSESGYLSDILSREAISFIKKESRQPFFLYLSYRGGLPPYQAHDLAEEAWGNGWEAHESSRSEYAAMVERMDSGLGSVLAELNSEGIDKNTLVIFTYDHGGRHLSDSGSLFHGFGTLWEGGIRVPLIMRWPDTLVANKTLDSVSINMDVTATMLDAIGAQKEKKLGDGKSLLETEKPSHSERPIFWRNSKMRAVRLGPWKYLVDGHSQFLFDLDGDIGERTNLFYRYPEKVTELKALLQAWELSVD